MPVFSIESFLPLDQKKTTPSSACLSIYTQNVGLVISDIDILFIPFSTHVNKHHDRRHLMSKMSSDHQQTTFSPQLRRAVEVIHADANYSK